VTAKPSQNGFTTNCRTTRLPDLLAILDRLSAEPDAEAHWSAMADHLRDDGEYDLADRAGVLARRQFR